MIPDPTFHARGWLARLQTNNGISLIGLPTTYSRSKVPCYHINKAPISCKLQSLIHPIHVVSFMPDNAGGGGGRDKLNMNMQLPRCAIKLGG